MGKRVKSKEIIWVIRYFAWSADLSFVFSIKGSAQNNVEGFYLMLKRLGVK